MTSDFVTLKKKILFHTKNLFFVFSFFLGGGKKIETDLISNSSLFTYIFYNC